MRSKETVSAEGAFVSLIGHITIDELAKKLNDVEVANGFANRMMFVAAKRRKLLPLGGRVPPDEFNALVQRARQAIERARTIAEITMTFECAERWGVLYRTAFPDEAGMAGALLARGETQTLRMAVAFAALDGSRTLGVKHLNAAYALWQYVEASTRHIFGKQLGDEVQQRLLEELRAIYAEGRGLDRTQQRDLFARHKSSARLEAARHALIGAGLAREETVHTQGATRYVLHAVPLSITPDPRAISALGALGSPERPENGESEVGSAKGCDFELTCGETVPAADECFFEKSVAAAAAEEDEERKFFASVNVPYYRKERVPLDGNA